MNDIEIDDETFMQLLELPPNAFELCTDPATGKERLRVKSSYLREQAKLMRLVVTEKNLSKDDFEMYVDPVTGKTSFKLKADVAKLLGIPEGYEDMIELYLDENGNQMMKFRNGLNKMTIGDTIYELVIDPKTGKQTLKMTTKQKVGEEKLDDVLRLAGRNLWTFFNRLFI